jgi:hypothetical protein
MDDKLYTIVRIKQSVLIGICWFSAFFKILIFSVTIFVWILSLICYIIISGNDLFWLWKICGKKKRHTFAARKHFQVNIVGKMKPHLKCRKNHLIIYQILYFYLYFVGRKNIQYCKRNLRIWQKKNVPIKNISQQQTW